jgi:hypothetical protein
MKEININGINLKYQTFYDACEYGESTRTEFYLGTVVIIKKKWVFYGPTYEEVIPKKIFTIFADTQNANLSRDWWRAQIEKHLTILNRAEEIAKGEII